MYGALDIAEAQLRSLDAWVDAELWATEKQDEDEADEAAARAVLAERGDAP